MHLCCKAMFLAVYNSAKFKVFGQTFVMLNVWLRKLVFFNGLANSKNEVKGKTVSSLLQTLKIFKTCFLKSVRAVNQFNYSLYLS